MQHLESRGERATAKQGQSGYPPPHRHPKASRQAVVGQCSGLLSKRTTGMVCEDALHPHLEVTCPVQQL